jgi:hypothetical protein
MITEQEVEEAFNSGKYAAERDLSLNRGSLNPYPGRSKKYKWWGRGYSYIIRLSRAIAAESKLKDLNAPK